MIDTGSVVVCIDAKCHFGGDMDGLKEGGVYTVRWAGYFLHINRPVSLPHVHLSEITHRFCKYHGVEVPYLLSRFRPAKPTDISVFTKELKRAPKREDA
jgi:hypothetical protein